MISIRVPTNTGYQPLAKAWSCSKNIICVKRPLITDGCILIDIDIEDIVPFFGSGTKEENDEDNYIRIFHEAFSEIV